MRSTKKQWDRSRRHRSSRVMLVLTAVLAFGVLGVGVLAAFGGSEEPAPEPQPAEPVDREYVLEAFLDGYVGLEGEIEGEINPVLTASAGETVRITIINNEAMRHDVVMEEHGASSEIVTGPDAETSVTFVAETDDVYYCSVPGHRAAGMEGEFRLE